MTLLHVDVFSGVGGWPLAARMAGGIRTVGLCEIDPFCRRVLARHFPDAHQFEDVHDVTADTLRAAGIPRIDLLTGSAPCQPWSVAGPRTGASDGRNLWPEMCRVVADARPAWVCGENVVGLVRPYLDTVLGDLERLGYAVWPVVVPASAVGAPHRRERLWFVAHADGARRDEPPHDTPGRGADWGAPGRLEGSGHAECGGQVVAHADGLESERGRIARDLDRSPRGVEGEGGERERMRDAARGGGATLADADGAGCELERVGGLFDRERAALGHDADGRSGAARAGCGLAQPRVGREPSRLPDWLDRPWPARPGEPQAAWEPPRTARGVRDRARRLKALGNSIIPQIAAVFLRAIVEASQDADSWPPDAPRIARAALRDARPTPAPTAPPDGGEERL